MPCALDVCNFYTTHCWDIVKDEERANCRESAAVKDLSDKLKMSPEFLVQMLGHIFLDPHTKFLIRAWFGPATKESEM